MKRFIEFLRRAGKGLLDLFTDSNGNGDIVRLLGILTILDCIAAYIYGLPYVTEVFWLGVSAAGIGKIFDFAARPLKVPTPFKLADFLTDPDDCADIVRALAAIIVIVVQVKWWIDGAGSTNEPQIFLMAGFTAAAIAKLTDLVLPKLRSGSGGNPDGSA